MILIRNRNNPTSNPDVHSFHCQCFPTVFHSSIFDGIFRRLRHLKLTGFVLFLTKNKKFIYIHFGEKPAENYSFEHLNVKKSLLIFCGLMVFTQCIMAWNTEPRYKAIIMAGIRFQVISSIAI